MWKCEWHVICRLKPAVRVLPRAGRVCGNPRKSKADAPLLPSSSLSPFISSPFSTASLVFCFSVVCQMTTWILLWAAAAASASENIWVPEPRLGAVASDSTDTYRKIWSWSSTCSAPPSLERIAPAFFAAARAWFWVFPWSMVRSCLLVIYLSTDILDVDLSWPVFIWIWGERRRFCCVLCFGLPCVFLEGWGGRRGWSESSRRLHKSQYSLWNMLQRVHTTTQTGNSTTEPTVRVWIKL